VLSIALFRSEIQMSIGYALIACCVCVSVLVTTVGLRETHSNG